MGPIGLAGKKILSAIKGRALDKQEQSEIAGDITETA